MMDREELQQHILPKRPGGKVLVLSGASLVIRLCVMQILCSLLVMLTGIGLLASLFYLYAAVKLLVIVLKSVDGCVYTLTEDALKLERRMAGSTTGTLVIPLKAIVAARPVCAAEMLRLSYRQVAYIGAHDAPLRMKAAWAASLLSARLAVRLAGSLAHTQTGYAIVYNEGGRLRACVFAPDGAMQRALWQRLGERWEWDDRLARPMLDGLLARSLARAFPGCYPHVSPLITAEDEAWYAEWQAERAARKAERTAAKNEKKEKKGVDSRTEEGRQEAGNEDTEKERKL